ncbi:hypothetical protein AMAG_08940 [Allomyces macrogynus ATCC 38327]|uniref:Uncharacterized protein n=1 Tax=Allomyces macrogynus (strain ATCC 38327) TaxID=578462 RepID=A0A0L0SN11_ALLM3|nr:hypothetical protein AMAG_08940 [Allomyces macrogynus ATCC 38327]|eukprot:KNE63877.1 hypothetical protein AMAG_08940 [Allomyces macrogynus ATCC 38327]
MFDTGICILNGVDKARFAALHTANASLPFVSKIKWHRDKFPLDDMATIVNPGNLSFINQWVRGPPSSETHMRDDGAYITEIVWAPHVLVAMPIVNNLKFVCKSFGPDAAMDTFHAMLDQPGFTYNPDWIMIMLRALGACKKRDVGWERTLLAVVKSGTLPDARRADLIGGLVAAYHAEEEYSRTCSRAQDPDDAEIDIFLRESDASTSITGRFKGIKGAGAFAAQHSGSPPFLAEACAHIRAIQQRRDAEELMRNYVEFCGEEVTSGVGEGDVQMDVDEVEAHEYVEIARLK